jgi:hypothetical protein
MLRVCASVGVMVLLARCGGSFRRPAVPPRTRGSVGDDQIVVESIKRGPQAKLTPAEYRKEFAEALRLMKKYCPSGCTFKATP